MMSSPSDAAESAASSSTSAVAATQSLLAACSHTAGTSHSAGPGAEAVRTGCSSMRAESTAFSCIALNPSAGASSRVGHEIVATEPRVERREDPPDLHQQGGVRMSHGVQCGWKVPEAACGG